MPLDLGLVDSAGSVIQQIGFLISDALIVAVMHSRGLSKIASNDTDFDRVPGLQRYAPA